MMMRSRSEREALRTTACSSQCLFSDFNPSFRFSLFELCYLPRDHLLSIDFSTNAGNSICCQVDSGQSTWRGRWIVSVGREWRPVALVSSLHSWKSEEERAGSRLVWLWANLILFGLLNMQQTMFNLSIESLIFQLGSASLVQQSLWKSRKRNASSGHFLSSVATATPPLESSSSKAADDANPVKECSRFKARRLMRFSRFVKDSWNLCW